MARAHAWLCTCMSGDTHMSLGMPWHMPMRGYAHACLHAHACRYGNTVHCVMVSVDRHVYVCDRDRGLLHVHKTDSSFVREVSIPGVLEGTDVPVHTCMAIHAHLHAHICIDIRTPT